MDIITWDKNYQTGHPVIDGQHKNLFKMINELNTSIEDGSSYLMLAETMKKLSVYVSNHFKTEEDLMIKYSYSEYTAHKHEHDNLKEQTAKLNKLLTLKKVDLTATISQFLSDWLQNHIKETDMRFIEWMSKK